MRMLSIAVGGLLLAALTVVSAQAEEKGTAKADRLFEMRTYVANDGKFDDLHKRFREHTNKLFVKHGMDLVGYWVPADGAEAENTLVYILAYPDLESREKSWKAFLGDPDWQAVYKASHANGPLVKTVESRYLKPTDYSPIQ